MVAQTLQGCRGGQGYGRRVVEGEGGRFRRQEIFRDTYILSKCAKSVHKWAPEHVITRPEHRDVLADRFDPPSHIATQNPVLRFSQSELQASNVRRPSQEVPVGGVHASRMNAQKHLVVSRLGLVDLREF